MGAGMKEEDEIKFIVPAMSHDQVLIFTNQGIVFGMETLDLPEGASTGKGKHLKNLIALRDNEHVVTLLPIRDALGGNLIFVTAKGLVKQTPVDQFQNIQSKGRAAITITQGDSLVRVLYADQPHPLFLQTQKGMCIQFDSGSLRPSGRTAQGVCGMRLKPNDQIIDAELITTQDPQILIVTELGYAKRVDGDNFRLQNRGGMGLKSHKTGSGDVVALLQVHPGDELMAFSRMGQAIRVDCETIRETGRVARGVRIMDLQEDDMVTSIGLIREL